ncbi:hypothetical protein L7750_10445 [Xenorhabdus bovienii]|uniref:Uncharacterized protein n=2 Tax=Xenorhabdus bovienii TaxID=40576 RepID=A0A077NAG9_XENBV|nr:hypothetical protein [Xenorhabdus bovienii]MCG3470795.1 hypothetical protein [Xenorhabdus bovienii]CDG89350.1 hypothetical protein XBFFR1_2470004 [Xenorhabdus bovienii str. feltiae France]CDG94948.1 hypothetical protein XBFFL1_940004 [Xenorhabdus bovienii str. feltiae Florida]CDG95233.1 hypothetical protein XBP1_1120023 [Xenorhabdus bovienii str. puntauvense]CDH01695.1 hypothetical protein XBFM1_2280028 [Xenorhabdus bovienii str. feltiae Moldova]
MVELKPGKHVLETSDGKKQPFLVYSKNQGGIINPNRELYYTYNMVYAIENHENKFSPQNTEVVIDGVTLYLLITMFFGVHIQLEHHFQKKL